ncbi:MAG: hypothetical protein LBE84_06970 [Planctomycetota bacterium]|nr:hypothetical protein [Planctomycetota bacterium]
MRFLWVKLYYYPQVRMEGFVFFESGVMIKVEPEARIVVKNRVYLKKGCILECSGKGNMILHENSCVGHYSLMGCRDSLVLGRNSFIGQSCTLIDTKHDFTDIHAGVYCPGKCHVGADSVIFGHTSIGPDVEIADRTMILSHSVVTKSITEPGWMWSGIPAVKKKGVAHG